MPDRIKVFYLIERMARAGTELSLLNLLQGIDRSRFEPVLCCLNEERTDRELIPPGIPYHTLDAKWNLASPATLGLYRRLCRLLREERPHIVHSFLFVSNVLGPLAARKARVGATVASRGRMGIVWQAHFLHRLAQRFASQRTDLILCKTQAIGEEIARVERVPLEKIHVVTNGVDTRHYRPTMERDEARRFLCESHSIPLDRPLILAVGNLKPIKSQVTLIEAAACLRARGCPVRVAVVGEGEAAESLRATIETHRLENEVHLPGRIGDVRPWMNAADLFVATSLSEGMPNALLEAMSMGLPAVLSQIPGHAETAADTAWYFEPRNGVDLAETVIRALGADDERGERGRAGAARVQQEFSLEHMVKRIEGYYTELLSRRPLGAETRS